MFKTIRRLSGNIAQLDRTLRKGISLTGDQPRLDSLEAKVITLTLSLDKRIAEAEALVMKADALKKVAMNAEARTNAAIEKAAAETENPFERDFEGEEDFPPEYYGQLQERDAGGSRTVGVRDLPAGMASTRRMNRREKAIWRMNGRV